MEKALETREKIVDIVKAKGPVLPVQVGKEIGMSILMASAHLAELTASGILKISSIKVGGSPLYYFPGQQPLLQKYTGSMNDKEKKAFDLLSQNKILRDSEQEPVIRVALREIRDFAMPLNVKYKDSQEIFWKWYLAADQEAENLIKTKLGIEKAQEKKAEAVQKIKEKPAEKSIDKAPKQIKDIQQQKLEKPAEQIQKEIKPIEKPQEKRGRKPREKEDLFLRDLTRFFEKNKINVIDTTIIKRNSEVDFIVEIPSVVGNLQYYCKAKKKKRISDSDLSNAYVKGQFKKLPVIVLAPGELSAKAGEMIRKELNNITFKQV